ncbi:serine/threonine-protein kinase [Nonomuraea aurantiaca]|uniref:serine/threonine-protein kinase n=1 Tax=Nonomuraea aurantiaca TaxID=2878562 RepID=UPI001CD9EA02|nr:serine/threonine-protein kinase [Nonomuraea aurantiaca]MCA2220515.1 protein kinase [Nonomuraea aurantiaca]
MLPVEDAPGYRVLDQAGQGGFAIVYRAYQERLDRIVALKVLSVDRVDQRTMRRFQRELQLTGRLTGHPNVVTVFDTGVTRSGKPYIAMDFFENGSLRDKVRKEGPLQVPDVLRAGVKLAGALAAVHEAGVLHGDIKPQNILISRYGEPAVADFGVARVVDSAEISATAQAFTPLHAAPEVLTGQPHSASSDIYSLGSTLYHLLAGQPAFHSPTDPSIAPLMYRVLSADPPPINRPDVPPVVFETVLRAMAKQPEVRYGSAREFAHRLRQVQAELGLPVTDLVGQDPGPPVPSTAPRRADSAEPPAPGPSTGAHLAGPATGAGAHLPGTGAGAHLAGPVTGAYAPNPAGQAGGPQPTGYSPFAPQPSGPQQPDQNPFAPPPSGPQQPDQSPFAPQPSSAQQSGYHPAGLQPSGPQFGGPQATGSQLSTDGSSAPATVPPAHPAQTGSSFGAAFPSQPTYPPSAYPTPQSQPAEGYPAPQGPQPGGPSPAAATHASSGLPSGSTKTRVMAIGAAATIVALAGAGFAVYLSRQNEASFADPQRSQPPSTAAKPSENVGKDALAALAPRRVRVVADRSTLVELRWALPKESARYPVVVQRSPARQGEQAITALQPGTTSTRVSGLDPDTGYCFLVGVPLQISKTSKVAWSKPICVRGAVAKNG